MCLCRDISVSLLYYLFAGTWAALVGQGQAEKYLGAGKELRMATYGNRLITPSEYVIEAVVLCGHPSDWISDFRSLVVSDAVSA